MSHSLESSAHAGARAAPAPGARVVVVGAAGGLGSALTQACERLQMNVAAMDLPEALARLGTGPSVHRIPIDATNEQSTHDAFAAAVDRLGGVDHLFHLVGFSTIPPKPLRETGVAEWDRLLNGNLRSAFLSANAALPLMRAPGASAVFVSSAMTAAPSRGYGAYVAAKCGIAGLVKALALESAPGIRVNAVAPSAMLTPFMGGGPLAGKEDPAGWSWFDAKAAAAVVPMGRLCTPDDVIGPMLFLSSPMAGFITGQVLHVSGGRVLA